jgi:hypothetical protein
MSEAFFHSRNTHQWIQELSDLGDVTFFAGLGTTIDRTGLSWPKLMDRLLTKFVASSTTRQQILQKYSPIQVATVLDGYYAELYSEPEHKLEALRRDLHEALYGPNSYLAGRFSESIAELSLELARNGKSVVIVTPNYEEYLLLDFVEKLDAQKKKDGATAKTEIVLEALIVTDTTELPREWEAPGHVTFIFLHGYVPKDLTVLEDKNLDLGIPVLSEGDYGNRGDLSRRVLARLFENRNVIVVGSSMTDSPLVNALIDTRDTGDKKRVALLPEEGGVTTTSPAGHVTTWRDRRLQHMRVTPIYPDFYIQAGQFLHEIRMLISRGDRDDITKAFSPHRYGSRLVRWSQNWQHDVGSHAGAQQIHHELLRDALAVIRKDLSVPLDENLKLEAWVRWQPDSRRVLALWASSIGNWVDPYLMRTSEITKDSRYSSVEIFCNGAPKFVYEKGEEADFRWRAYLGTPIWIDEEDGRVPVGVITLASMKDEGTIHHSNIRDLDAALLQMRKVGKLIVAPGQTIIE